MRQSNTYIIIFTAVLTIIVGGLLSLANTVLGPAQKKSIELDTKSQILNAVMEIKKGDDVLSIYKQRITSLVVDFNGDEIDVDEKGKPIKAEDVNILKNYKKDPEKRQYPVFRFMNEDNPTQVDAYILPVYGNGLWDKIWGFIALDKDLESITGISFAHKQETPGLGARISDSEIEGRFVGKKIFDDQRNLVSVTFQKGERGGGEASIRAFEDQPHKVDGLSGATLTAKGVNAMLKDYLTAYQGYMKKIASQKAL